MSNMCEEETLRFIISELNKEIAAQKSIIERLSKRDEELTDKIRELESKAGA